MGIWLGTQLLHALVVSKHTVQKIKKKPHPGKIPSLGTASFFLPQPMLTHFPTHHLLDSLSLAPKYST